MAASFLRGICLTYICINLNIFAKILRLDHNIIVNYVKFWFTCWKKYDIITT